MHYLSQTASRAEITLRIQLNYPTIFLSGKVKGAGR